MGGGYLSNLSIKKTKGFIIGTLLGIIIGSSIGVYAANKLSSNLVLYNNEVTNVGNVKEALDELFVKANTKFLAEVVSVGDYVAYDAGEWTETKAIPTSQGNFGGYTSGNNKANSVTCNSSATLKGWRVLKIENNQVYLVHAGQPECYFHAYGYSDASVKVLNARAASEYFNGDYADSAHMMNYDEALTITGSADATTNTLRNTGAYYWIAYRADGNGIGYVYDGEITASVGMAGVRPVIVLKPNIKTTGKVKDAVGTEAWNLIAP